MLLCTLTTGDAVHRYNKRIVVQFKGPRKVLSTSILNGGYREDLKAVFNHDCSTGNDTDCTLRAPTYEEHMRLNAQDLGFDADTVTGMEQPHRWKMWRSISVNMKTLRLRRL